MLPKSEDPAGQSSLPPSACGDTRESAGRGRLARRELVGLAGLAGLGVGLGSLAQPAEGGFERELTRPEHPPRGPAALFVAAVDAPAELRGVAHERCDGTNDQVKIQSALDRLGTTGGVVQLSEGTFQLSGPVRLARRQGIAGRGRATILRVNGTWEAFDGSSPGAAIEPLDDGTDKTLIAHLAVDGNRWAGGDTKGIYYNITRKDSFDEGPDAGHSISDVYIHRTAAHGVHLTGSHMRANHVSRVRVYNVGHEGSAEPVHGYFLDCPDSFYSQCETGSSAGSGFLIRGANNRFTNCKSWYSDGHGYEIRAVRNQLAACEAQDNEQHGYYITSGPNSLVGCHADSNSWNPDAPGSSHDGFHLPWGSRIQLIGCSAYDKGEGGRVTAQRWGFYLGSTCEHCQVIATTMGNALGGIGGTGAASPANLIVVNG